MSQDIDRDYEKQKIMIENLLSSPDLFALCANIVDHSYFAPELRNTVEFILAYYDEYHTTPRTKIIRAETGVELETSEKVSVDEFDYTAAEIEQFCKERAVLNEILQAGKHIESGDYGTLVEKIESAVLISLNRDLGTDICEGVEARIKKRQEERQPISTGWPGVDEILGGGLCRTELFMLSGNSGGGKSISLSNLSLNFVEQGHDVLYVSLELSEDMIADRFETMITGWDKATKYDRIAETATKVEQLRATNGASIYVKYLEAESNSNDIKAYLKEFELKYKKLPTLLVVDYLDCFGTNERQQFSNVFEKDKASSTQLRAIGNNPHYDMVMATASQQNRGAINETDMNQGHIAGGLSKVNISDVYASIIMTDAMRAEGVADFAFLKTRSSDGVGKTAHMKWDPIRLKFTSMNDSGLNFKTMLTKTNKGPDKDITNNSDDDDDNNQESLLDLMDM